MTTIALKGFSLVRKGIIGALASWMLGHAKAVGRAVELSRSIRANEDIARVLLPEYREHTYHSLLAELNRKTMERVYGK